MIIIFDKEIEVVAKQRPVPFVPKNNYKARPRMITPKKTRDNMSMLKDVFFWHMKFNKLKKFSKGTLLKISFKIHVPGPSRGMDLDNFYKCFTDAANDVFYEDDSQIRKWGEGEMIFKSKPHLWIRIEELSFDEKRERGILL